MTLTFVTNLVHHHQLPVADEFYGQLGDDYHYIATHPLPEWLVKGGYNPSLDRPYIIRTYLGDENMQFARRLIDESDVVIIGSAPLDWVYKRKKENKVTFHYSERWLKTFSLKIFYPKGIYLRWKHFTQFRDNRLYMLCASAFTSKDVKWYGAFPHKCFKWGYFTKVDEEFLVEAPNLGASTSEITPLMWCARFLRLKHPELPVQLANRLKQKGYKFNIDMFGSGDEFQNIEAMISKLGVSDCVKLKGNLPNEDILKEMRKHSIFLFTSDRNEGWGAVLNEAMSNGCAVVGSHEIGSVPFLIRDGENGLIFKSKSISSLEKKVTYLMDHPDDCLRLREEAVRTMKEVWSPYNAAKSFIKLASYACDNMLNKYNNDEGPASWA